MNSPRADTRSSGGRELLADRKALLLARSSLYRLSLLREAQVLRESLHWRNLASSATHSGALRPLVFGALLVLAGRSRVARVLGLATRIIAIVKTVQALRGLARRRKAP